MILIREELSFLSWKKKVNRIETKNNICINVFCYENGFTFPIYILDQKCENSMDLLLIFDGAQSHYLFIKDFDRFMFHKTKNKNKNYFWKICLQCFSSKSVLTEHKKVCLGINSTESARLLKGTVELKNLFKKILIPFKNYSDFECILNRVESYEGFCSKKYHNYIPCSFAYKLVCVDDKFRKPIVIYRGKNAAYKFFKAILNIVKK